MHIDPKEYETYFFKQKGFIRKKCPICGGYFWTLNADRETCGDVECEKEYRFIRNINPTQSWDIHNTIANWTEFFRKRGHEVLEYYPVVARWRDDIYFTIASIAIFQPWVTNGLVDPPANPLVIAQPCIRFGGEFSDIDRIGRTGRHLSSFTMGGQHAFNSEKWRGGYWKERYLELNFEFITKVLGIPAEELTYKEDWWQGGGNAGPSIETFAYGLEIVNGVFMKYRITNGSLEPIPIRVLDVGWGLERIAWLMQGTPTIYEATFGPLYTWLKKQLGIEIDRSLLLRYGRYVGAVRTETEGLFNETRKMLAKNLGITIKEFNKIFGPLEAMYAILDHVKTVVMAIPDGGIPANIGGAANLRAILRRAISLAEKYDLDVPWDELIARTIQYFSKTFHRLKGIESVAVEIWHVESDRFAETIEKALRELRKIIKRRKAKIIDDPILRELYLNYGIPPEEIDYLSQKLNLGIQVKVSPNFYESIRTPPQRISEECEAKETSEKARLLEILEDRIKDLPPTRPLYYEDQFLREFEANILLVEKNFLILDQTAFYPRGGGQEGDSGVIIVNGKQFRVINVFKLNNIVVHELDRPAEGLRGKVRGIIDWDKRLALMRHHTATHIINGAAQRVLGPHVWQMGAEKKPEKSHLDISHFKNLSFDEIKRIEELANRVVLEDRPIHIEFMSRTEAERKFGVKIYQGGAVPSATLRIVNIEGWDVEACGGTHLPRTILVGPIKILSSKKIHDGIIRLEFVAGEHAIRHTILSEKYLREACNVFRVQPDKLAETAKRFFTEWKRQKDELQKLWGYILNNIEKLISDKVTSRSGKTYLLERIDVDLRTLLAIINRLQNKVNNILLVSTTLGENIFAAAGESSFIKLIKESSIRLGAEFRETKNRIFGKLNAPSDNLLTVVKKRLL